jgi:two-component system response regulator YesN
MYSIKKLEKWSECKIIGDIYSLISALIKEGRTADANAQSREKTSVLNDAIEYIRNNYDKDISVEDIAKKVNVHRTNLYRLFKEKFDISVIKYLKNYRLDIAASLLVNSDLTAYEISEKVGMTDYPHFSKQFKASYRFTPTTYRKKFKGKTPK